MMKTQEIDAFLFGNGIKIEDYLLRVTPVSETLCFIAQDGREFYVPISDDDLADAAIQRLKDLSVRIVTIGY